MSTIRAIYGTEPRREGEYPICFEVGSPAGYPSSLVTRIDKRQDNLGSYGIIWFCVFSDDALIAEINALEVAQVTFQQEPHP